MSAIDEATLWDRLANARRIPLNPTWLGEIFSPSLSDELRFAVAERLGMLAETGWPIIPRHQTEPQANQSDAELKRGNDLKSLASMDDEPTPEGTHPVLPVPHNKQHRCGDGIHDSSVHWITHALRHAQVH